jgi:predicted alpha/beta superfamily hydrolase
VNHSAAVYLTHDVEEHLIRSTWVAQTYRIKVLQPVTRADGSERFPVVYMTDSDEFFGGIANLASILQLLGETPRFILVAIGYENAGAEQALRMRDLLSHNIRARFRREIEQIIDSPLVSGVKDVRAITHATDAKDFLRFIRDELMPLINSRYPVIPGDNSYTGYSGGGTFGLYTLFTQPDTFKRYILGSPATSYGGHHFGIELADAFLKTRRAIDARVFMSVGELEEFKRGQDQFDLVSGYYQLAKFLKQRMVAGLELTLRVFPGETHATAWTLAFSHGMRTLFGPVEEVPYWPEFLKRGIARDCVQAES